MTGIVIHRTLRPSSSPGRFSPAKRTCSGYVWGVKPWWGELTQNKRWFDTHKMTFQCWLKGHISLICSLLLHPSSSHDQISPFKFLCGIRTCSRFTDFIGTVIYLHVFVQLALFFLESYLKNKIEPNEFLTIWGPILNPNCPNPPSKPHDGWL